MQLSQQPTREHIENKRLPFQIGVNYWPQRTAMRFWREFDTGELREDFDRLAEWRLSPVRVFPRWEDFQPDCERINTRALRHLEKLADLAADRGLSLWICLFVGHAHRANWLPYWMVSNQPRLGAFPTLVEGFAVPARPKQPIVEPGLIHAQRRLLSEIRAVLHNHPSLWAYDLGDRLSSLYESMSTEDWRRWLGEMISEIRRWDTLTPVTLGLQPKDLLHSNGLTPALAAQVCDFVSMAGLTRDTYLAHGLCDPVVGLFLAELTRFLAEGKTVWISAMGLATTSSESKTPRQNTRTSWPTRPETMAECEQLMPESQAEEYARLGMECLRRHGVPGALWWCYADYPFARKQEPFDRFPVERSFGLLGSEWRPKRILAGIQAVERVLIPQAPDTHWQDIEPEQYWRAPLEHIRRLYDRFRDQIPLSRY